MGDKLLTTDELAERWHMTRYALAMMRMRGTGPAFLKISHKKVLYKEADVVAFEEENYRADTAGATA